LAESLESVRKRPMAFGVIFLFLEMRDTGVRSNTPIVDGGGANHARNGSHPSGGGEGGEGGVWGVGGWGGVEDEAQYRCRVIYDSLKV
jgi:hypothetical protein